MRQRFIALIYILFSFSGYALHQDIFDAVALGDISLMQQLVIGYNANINEKNAFGDILLIHAVRLRSQKIADWLLINGANPNLTNELNRNALHEAAIRNDLGIARILLYYGASPCTQDSFGETPLDWAKRHGSPQMIDLFSLNNQFYWWGRCIPVVNQFYEFKKEYLNDVTALSYEPADVLKEIAHARHRFVFDGDWPEPVWNFPYVKETHWPGKQHLHRIKKP